MEEVVAAVEEAQRRRVLAGERRKQMLLVALAVFGLTGAAVAGWKSLAAARAQERAENALSEVAEARGAGRRGALETVGGSPRG